MFERVRQENLETLAFLGYVANSVLGKPTNSDKLNKSIVDLSKAHWSTEGFTKGQIHSNISSLIYRLQKPMSR